MLREDLAQCKRMVQLLDQALSASDERYHQLRKRWIRLPRARQHSARPVGFVPANDLNVRKDGFRAIWRGLHVANGIELITGTVDSDHSRCLDDVAQGGDVGLWRHPASDNVVDPLRQGSVSCGCPDQRFTCGCRDGMRASAEMPTLPKSAMPNTKLMVAGDESVR